MASSSSMSSLKAETIDLGNGSDVVFIQRLIPSEQSWKWFNYLDKHIPWTRPTIRVFGKSFLQVILSSLFNALGVCLVSILITDQF